MSYAAVNTIHPPTAVHLCASAFLEKRLNSDVDDSSPQLPNLVIIRGNVLEVLSVRQQRCSSKLTSEDESPGLTSSVAGAVLEVVSEYRLNGVPESIAVVPGKDGKAGRKDSLLLSFGEAKLSVVEFDDLVQRLRVSSLHYLEGPEWQARQRGRLSFPRPPLVRSDRQGACAAALLMRCYLHVVTQAAEAERKEPLHQTQTSTQSQQAHRQQQHEEEPSAPRFNSSFTLDLRHHDIQNARDFAFLYPHSPSPATDSSLPLLAILWEEHAMWGGRLGGGSSEAFAAQFCCAVSFFQLDLAARSMQPLGTTRGLPYDCYSLSPTPLPSSVLVLSTRTIHLCTAAQASSPSNLAVSDAAPPSFPSGAPIPRSPLQLDLEEAHVAWAVDGGMGESGGEGKGVRGAAGGGVREAVGFIATKGGSLAVLRVAVASEAASSSEPDSKPATASPPPSPSLSLLQLRLTSPASALTCVGPSLLFVGSAVGDSVLVRYRPVFPADGLSGTKRPHSSSGGTEAMEGLSGFSFRLCDSLLQLAPIRDITSLSIPLAPTSASPHPSSSSPSPHLLLAACGHGKSGSLALLTSKVAVDVLALDHVSGCLGLWTVHASKPVSTSPGDDPKERQEADMKDADNSGNGGGSGGGGGGGDSGGGGGGKAGMDVDVPSADGAVVEGGHHSFVVMTFQDTSLILEAGEVLSPAPSHVQFCRSSPTVFATNLMGRRFTVQVCPDGIHVLQGSSRTQHLTLADALPAADREGEGEAESMAVEAEVGGEEGKDDVPMSDGNAVDQDSGHSGSGLRIVDTSAADPFVLMLLSDGSFRLLGPKGQAVLEAQRSADSDSASGSEDDGELTLSPVSFPLQSMDPIACFTLFGCSQSKRMEKGGAVTPPQNVLCAAARASGAVQIFHVPFFSLLFTTHGILQGQPLLALARKIPSPPSGAGPISSLAVCCYAPSRRLHLFAMLPGGQVKCYRSFTTSGEAPGDVLSSIACQVKEGTDRVDTPSAGRYHLDQHALEGARKLRFEHVVLDEVKGWQADEEKDTEAAGEGGVAAAGDGGTAAAAAGTSADVEAAANASKNTVPGSSSRPAFVPFSGLGVEQMSGVGMLGGGNGRGSSGGDYKEADGADGGGSEGKREGEGELTVKGLSGVFVTGRRPRWFVLQRDSVRLHGMAAQQSSHFISLAPFNIASVDHGFLLLTKQGDLAICQIPPHYSFTGRWPTLKIPLQVTPHFVTASPSGSHIFFVTSSPITLPIAPYLPTTTEEGQEITPSSAVTASVQQFELRAAVCPRVDLPASGLQEVQKVELEAMEMVTAMRLLSVKNRSTGSLQPLLVLTTAFATGEDTAGKGRVLLFALTSEGSGQPDSSAPLSLVSAREPAPNGQRGVVTAVASMQGFLLLAVARQLVVYHWTGSSLEEVAFFEAPMYIVSLATVKSFILFADISKGMYFLQWKEEGALLTLLSRDPTPQQPTAADFLIDGPNLGLVACDGTSSIQLFSYARTRDTQMGQRLLPRAAFHAGDLFSRVIRLPLPPPPSTPLAKSNRTALIAGTVGGAITVVCPVAEMTFRRLDSLQAALVNAVEHVAGLNPCAFRALPWQPNCPRPLVDHMIDCTFLNEFLGMDISSQDKQCNGIGSSRLTVCNNLRELEYFSSIF